MPGLVSASTVGSIGRLDAFVSVDDCFAEGKFSLCVEMLSNGLVHRRDLDCGLDDLDGLKSELVGAVRALSALGVKYEVLVYYSPHKGQDAKTWQALYDDLVAELASHGLSESTY